MPSSTTVAEKASNQTGPGCGGRGWELHWAQPRQQTAPLSPAVDTRSRSRPGYHYHRPAPGSDAALADTRTCSGPCSGSQTPLSLQPGSKYAFK
ncbi:UNVERIFIED_CONTAM: hypothetical protein K2H54_015920 [Gekko kuhli]